MLFIFLLMLKLELNYENTNEIKGKYVDCVFFAMVLS